MARTKAGVSPETMTETIHLEGGAVRFPNSLPAIRYIGPGTGVYFEKRAINGENLVMVKGQPVVIGDGSRGEIVSPEYADELVMAGKAEYVSLPAPEASEPANADPSAGAETSADGAILDSTE